LPLTVVSYDTRELGRESARLLCDHIDNASRREPGAPRRLVIPTRVVEYG
jgi:DNA-binding LacI/PurR family transcriptional regulator